MRFISQAGASSTFRKLIATILLLLLAMTGRSKADEPGKSQFECIGSFGESIRAFAAQGHIVYTAGGYVVRAVDISNPQRPKVIGWVQMQQPIQELTARGPAVYVGMSNGRGAWLVDATDPRHLRRVKEIGGGNRGTGVKLMGDFLYIDTAGKWGPPAYSLLNITDPLHPVVVDDGSLRGSDYDAFITDGKRLYTMHKTDDEGDTITLATEDSTNERASSIQTVDFGQSDPPERFDLDLKAGQVWLGEPKLANRVLIGKLDLTSDVWSISSSDQSTNYHYQFNGPWILSPYRDDNTGDSGYNLFHRSDLEKPVLTHKSNIAWMNGHCLYVDNDRNYIVYPLKDPLHLKGQPMQTQVSLYDVCQLAPGLALSKSWDDIIKIYDTSKPAHWTERGLYHQALDLTSLKVVDRVAYGVANRQLTIVDCHKPELPVEVSRCDLPSTVTTCAVEDDVVYAGGEEGKVYAIDVKQPAQPVLRGSGALPEDPRTMAASGSRLFVADGEAGVQVIDTSNPAAMKIIGQYKTPEPCVDLATSGTLVYALTPKTLCVLDASTSSTPALKGTLSYRTQEDEQDADEDGPIAIKRLGNALYLIRSETNGDKIGTSVKIVDVTTPSSPRLTDIQIKAGGYDDNPMPKSKTLAKPAPKPQFAGWVLGLPTSSHSTDGTEWAMEFYDLADPLQPVYVSGYYSRTECSRAVLYKDIIYKHNDEGGGVSILRRIKSNPAQGKH